MKNFTSAILSGAALSFSSPVQAALTIYTGSDNGVANLTQMIDSVAAANAFDVAVPNASIIDFESDLPAGVTITGGSTTSITSGSLYGFNTTLGGRNFRYTSESASVTFTFESAINAFGFYATGVQTEHVPGQTVTFSDGSMQVINYPSAINGGGVFIGFVDFGRSITSVTISDLNDIQAIDDVRFSVVQTAVPELPTWAMMIGGFSTIGGAMRRRCRKARLGPSKVTHMMSRG